GSTRRSLVGPIRCSPPCCWPRSSVRSRPAARPAGASRSPARSRSSAIASRSFSFSSWCGRRSTPRKSMACRAATSCRRCRTSRSGRRRWSGAGSPKTPGQRSRSPRPPSPARRPSRRCCGSIGIGEMTKSSAALDDAARPRATAVRESTLTCPACGTRTVHRYLYAKNRCDIFQCLMCGLGRSEAPAFDPAAYYTEGYFSGDHADGYADYLGAEPVLRREFARTVDFIRRYRRAGKLLEVGCAYGFFLQEAKRYFTVSGAELAADAAAYCRDQGLAVETGTRGTIERARGR